MVLLAGGCATIPISESVHVAKWKKTAFVSVTGNDYHATRIGTTVFNNKFAEWHPEGLDLDAKVTAALLPVLKANIPTTEFVADPGNVTMLRSTFKKPFERSYCFEPTEEYLSEIKAAGFDSLVLVRSSFVNDSSEYNPHWYSGVGILCRDFMGMHYAFAVASVDVVFYDLTASGTKPYDLRVFTETGLDGIPWRANWNDYSPEEQNRMTLMFGEVVADRLSGALNGKLESGLYPKNP